MSKKIENALDIMHQYLADVRAEKRASEKQALTNTTGPEPTAHPVMGADDGTVDAREGERSSENESDVRKDYGESGNTGQEDANAADGTNAADSIGTQSQESDEVSGNVQTPKDKKDGPAENGAGDASPNHPTTKEINDPDKKYASLINLGRDILTDFASAPQEKKAEEKKPAEKKAEEKPEEEGEKEAAAKKYPKDAESGYMAAATLCQNMGFGKQAANNEEQIVQSTIQNIVKSAQDDAVALHEFLLGLEETKASTLNKKAQGEELLGLGGGAGLGEEAPADLPPEVPPEGAGVPAEALLGGGEGGMGEEEAIVDALAEALQEAGVSPEELASAVAAEEGGMGGMGGMGGGEEMGMGMGMEAPPPEAPPMEAPPAEAPAPPQSGSGESEEEESEEKEEKEEDKEASLKKLANLVAILGNQKQ